jgi:hypothetical protein
MTETLPALSMRYALLEMLLNDISGLNYGKGSIRIDIDVIWSDMLQV